MKKKLMNLIALVAVCGCFAVGPNVQNSVKDGEVWLGITYLASKRGASPEATTAIAAIGLVDSVVWGMGVGMVTTGPFGSAAAGLAAGA